MFNPINVEKSKGLSVINLSLDLEKKGWQKERYRGYAQY